LVGKGGITEGTGDASGARRQKWGIWKRERLSAMLLSTSGTRFAVKVKLNFKVWKVIKRMLFIIQGIFELLADRIATFA